MTRAAMARHVFSRNDFIQPLLSSYNFRLISSSPKQTKNYLTVFNPFDRYIWAFLIASVVAVSIALTAIDMVYVKWSNDSTRGLLHKSNKR